MGDPARRHASCPKCRCHAVLYDLTVSPRVRLHARQHARCPNIPIIATRLSRPPRDSSGCRLSSSLSSIMLKSSRQSGTRVARIYRSARSDCLRPRHYDHEGTLFHLVEHCYSIMLEPSRQRPHASCPNVPIRVTLTSFRSSALAVCHLRRPDRNVDFAPWPTGVDKPLTNEQTSREPLRPNSRHPQLLLSWRSPR